MHGRFRSRSDPGQAQAATASRRASAELSIFRSAGIRGKSIDKRTHNVRTAGRIKFRPVPFSANQTSHSPSNFFSHPNPFPANVRPLHPRPGSSSGCTIISPWYVIPTRLPPPPRPTFDFGFAKNTNFAKRTGFVLKTKDRPIFRTIPANTFQPPGMLK